MSMMLHTHVISSLEVIMNIFYLDSDPVKAAHYMCDRHVVKMILETAQLLSTAHAELDGESPAYKPTHRNHPSAVWARESVENYNWLVSHLEALIYEHQFRYDKDKLHKTSEHLEALRGIPRNIPRIPLTPIKLAMPQYLKDVYSDDPVEAYRAYYAIEKQIFKDGKPATWTKRETPEWLIL